MKEQKEKEEPCNEILIGALFLKSSTESMIDLIDMAKSILIDQDLKEYLNNCKTENMRATARYFN